MLTGFDTYKIALYVDFAFVALTLNSVAPGERSCCLPGFVCADLTADSCVLEGGAPLGAGTSCACDPCAAPPGPPPVPDGREATTPLRDAKLTAAGDSIRVDWDATACPATGYNLIFGDLSHVAGYVLNGALCSIGTSGSYVWDLVPPGSLYFLIVGTDGAGTESSWGLDSANRERNGPTPSGACGVTIKNASRTCP